MKNPAARPQGIKNLNAILRLLHPDPENVRDGTRNDTITIKHKGIAGCYQQQQYCDNVFIQLSKNKHEL